MPPDLPEGPYRQAMELANEATFTPGELDAYQRVMDEIQQARELMIHAETAESRGQAKGEAKGRAEAKAEAVLAILAARGIPVDSATQARIAACTDLALLDRWIPRAATAASAEEVIAPSTTA
jgi:predicted deacylase